MKQNSEAPQGKRGMVVDLDRCTGCGACVTACAMENNLPWVGEDGNSYGRGMHWIRIQRYWEGEYPHVRARFIPVMCQQCHAAPCEPVCPVYAAVHSLSEDINLQVYNRCVGTRECAANCPYKIRIFNWYDWKHPEPLNLQLNPDVTRRRRGVMEKCTFCLQRLRRAQEDARLQGRVLEDWDVQPACVQVCPTNALVFGDLRDPESKVSKLSRSARGTTMLEELGTIPRVVYLLGEGMGARELNQMT